MGRAPTLVWSLTCAAVLSGCSLMGVGSLEVASCQNDVDCQAFVAALPGEACETFRCELPAGRCVAAPVDVDGDGTGPARCGGPDCDDADPAIGPHADEVCGNEVDEDCDGAANDRDCDGADRCVAASGDGCDCDDADGSVGPGASEVCNGIDDDCNGLLDGPDEDDDGDGHADQCAGALATDCDDEDPTTYVGADELCDGIDNDCVIDGAARVLGGSMPESSEDRDGDGHSASDARCLSIEGDPSLLPKDDCADRQAAAHPGAFEVCDGLDNDCDGVPDNVAGSEEPGGACLPTSVAAARNHTCAIRADGAVVCWGGNDYGELGTSDAVPPDAIVVVGLGRAMKVVGGDGWSCALQEGASGRTEVACWGREQLVRGGSSPSASFGVLHELDGASDLSAGEWHGCAIVEGAVWCWGLSRHCQVDGGTCLAGDVGLPPTRVPDIDDAVQVDAGMYVSCALRESGEVFCWGDNDRYQLAIEGLDHGASTVPGITDAEQVSCGSATCCAVRAAGGGSLWCWGDNATQALGLTPEDDVIERTATPLEISSGWDSPVTEVLVAGGSPEHCRSPHGSACARLASGEVRCWGANTGYALGPMGDDWDPAWFRECWIVVWHPSLVPYWYGPRRMELLEGLEGLSFGGSHLCGMQGSRVLCRGGNDDRELGRGHASWTDALEPATAIVGAAQTVGRCMRTPGLDVLCAEPIGVIRAAGAELGDTLDVGVGEGHVCLRRAGGEVRCSGRNDRGQLGWSGTGGPEVIGLADAEQVACGASHCCAARASGHVTCWGDNESGQLGVPVVEDASCEGECSSAPVPVTGIDSAVLQVVAGRDHSCALDDRGDVYCWGDNAQGQVGAWTRRNVRSPHLVPVTPGGDPVVRIAASAQGDATCAVLSSGRVRCWGASLHDDAAGGSDPWTVPGLDSAVEASMTRQSVCVRLASGAARCIGREGFDVDRFVDTISLGCGPGHCCLTRTSAQTLCWGEIPAGVAGDGGVSTTTPVQAVGLAVD